MNSEDPTVVEKPTSGPATGSLSGEDEELVGTVLNDNYRIERMVGEGGMSRVFEARHMRIAHKRYALKVLNADLSRNTELVERFQREADAVASLRHESIVEVFDVGVTPQGVPFMVYEFLDGQDLAILLEEVRSLDGLIAVRIARHVARGFGRRARTRGRTPGSETRKRLSDGSGGHCRGQGDRLWLVPLR